MCELGFGFLRLPLTPEKEVDYERLNPMVDAFLERGGRYFDTAYSYLKGNSETAIRESLVKRHRRDRFVVTDKLPTWALTCREDCRKYYTKQLQRCGLDRFDNYLLHWLNAEYYALAEKHDAFGFLRELKANGETDHIGFSYHDSAELLDRILTEHPEVDYVQLQINYLDWDSAGIQSGKCYETAVAHGKEVIVMEPVKGGTLAALPVRAEELLRSYRPDDSAAAWALGFVRSLEHVGVVLSGMSDLEQVLDNMKERPPLTEEELSALWKVRDWKLAETAIGCTGCAYCEANCPQSIAIPQYFALYNEHCRNPGENWKLQPVYAGLAQAHGKASDCVQCGACENHCPQKLPIRQWLKKVAEAME